MLSAWLLCVKSVFSALLCAGFLSDRRLPGADGYYECDQYGACHRSQYRQINSKEALGSPLKAGKMMPER
jgi:hypothetical protein